MSKSTLTLRIKLGTPTRARADLSETELERRFFRQGLRGEFSGAAGRKGGKRLLLGLAVAGGLATVSAMFFRGDAPALPAPVPLASVRVAPRPAAAAPAPDKTTAAAPGVVVETGECDAAFASRHWKAAAGSCAQAFDAAPDAGLALKVAHANYARGKLPDALTWARRAVEMDASAAEAYVIIGAAEQNAGRTEAAATAYRRYLQLAPRGWHARDVRAILANL